MMLSKPHIFSTLIGSGYFVGVGLPILLISVGGVGCLVMAVPAVSLILLALSMAVSIELYFLIVGVSTRGIQSQGRFSPSHVLRHVQNASHILMIASVLFPLWIMGILIVRLFKPPHVEVNLVFITAVLMILINGAAAILLQSTTCRNKHFESRFGLFKKLLIPSCIALMGGVTAMLLDAGLLIDDIGALLIMGWFMYSARLEDLGI
ncbi:MAG: hypothetical protein RIF37_06770 [Rhodospirillaceae bacterium]